ncbi:MAG: hypothetical protein OEW91_16290, partial [Acidimicrobiia bacterium]|nr:hypothetical protein [Acidimicrobiia bacterium]
MSGSSTRQHAEVRFEIDLRDSSVGANNVVVIPGLAGGRLGRATRLQKATKRGIDIMGAITALTL